MGNLPLLVNHSAYSPEIGAYWMMNVWQEERLHRDDEFCARFASLDGDALLSS